MDEQEPGPEEYRDYTVSWTIQVSADSTDDAALQAFEIQRDPEATATVFHVERHPLPGDPEKPGIIEVVDVNAQSGHVTHLPSIEQITDAIAETYAEAQELEPWPDEDDEQGEGPQEGGTHEYPTRLVLGSALDESMTLIGDSGGLSSIYEIDPSSLMMGMLQVLTEHGPLYLDPDSEYAVLDEEDDVIVISDGGDTGFNWAAALQHHTPEMQGGDDEPDPPEPEELADWEKALQTMLPDNEPDTDDLAADLGIVWPPEGGTPPGPEDDDEEEDLPAAWSQEDDQC